MILEDMKRTIILVAFSACFVLVSSAPARTSDDDSLVLIQLLMRHGNRSALMPVPGFEQQYINTYQPFQNGQLLPQGRRQVAEVGSYIRRRYNSFLPEEFSYDAVTAKCAQSPRVQESSAVFLANVFPNTNTKQQWEDSGMGSTWTPIPCEYLPKLQDYVLGGDEASCPRFAQLYEETLNSARFQEGFNNITANGTVNAYIAEHMNLTEPVSFQYLTAFTENVYAAVGAGITLPEWAQKLYPHPTLDIARFHQSVSFFTEEMSAILMGEFLKEIFNTAEQLQNNQTGALKLVSYLAHDSQIMALIQILDLLPSNVEPDYGALIIMELHRNQTTSNIGYKFLYRNHNWLEPSVLTVPGCEEICPLEYVKNYVKKYIPTKTHFEYCEMIKYW